MCTHPLDIEIFVESGQFRTWSYQYDPFCWSCVVYGDFEMSRA